MAHSERIHPRHFCGLRRRSEAKRDSSAQEPFAPPRICPRHGLADCIPCAFHQVGTRAGETVLIQGATGGMATALIQLGRAAGFEVWATSRSEEGRAQAKALGAHQSFPSNEALPRKVPVVIDNVGADSWAQRMSSLARGGTLVTVGGTTGFDVALNLL